MNRNTENLIELYSDYLLVSTSKTTATGLSELLENAYSHDQFTRLLSNNKFASRELWLRVKSVVRQIEQDDGVLYLMILSKKNHTPIHQRKTQILKPKKYGGNLKKPRMI